MTGFPGFLGTRLIRRLLQLHPDCKFNLLVHPSQLEKARQEVQLLTANGQAKNEQFSLYPGDITAAGLGLGEHHDRLQDSITHVFHLAAIYDLAVPQDIAYKVNVIGTQNVNDWVLQLPNLQRYIYFSTAYVSGTRNGCILETELDKGQSFKNFYESTKFEAEKSVDSIRDRVPVTIIRPGITMGDSKTGETAKFDGPYFIMRFLDKFSKLPLPYVGDGPAPINLVPVDYVVEATCYLGLNPIGADKVYHLTDPRPYTAREAYRFITRELTGKEPSFTVPLGMVSAMLSVPQFRRWVLVEKETLDYFTLPAEYDNTNAINDLAGSGITCPDFADYIRSAIAYYKEHRYDQDKMIKVV